MQVIVDVIKITAIKYLHHRNTYVKKTFTAHFIHRIIELQVPNLKFENACLPFKFYFHQGKYMDNHLQTKCTANWNVLKRPTELVMDHFNIFKRVANK